MLPTPEEGPVLSRSERIEQSGITLEDVNYYRELAVDRLPPIEGGTMIRDGSERSNRMTRIAYLKDQLGINCAEVPNPVSPGKMLPERLVSDVLVDLVTLCHIVRNAPEGTDAQPWIKLFNSLLQFRRDKGHTIETRLPDGETSHYDFAVKHNYSPGRSENPVRPGYCAQILTSFESALKAKSGA